MNAAWEALDLELIDDGYVARVTRQENRWRWAASKLDEVRKWNRRVTSLSGARGYSGTKERAIQMAEAAIKALRKADGPKGTP